MTAANEVIIRKHIFTCEARMADKQNKNHEVNTAHMKICDFKSPATIMLLFYSLLQCVNMW